MITGRSACTKDAQKGVVLHYRHSTGKTHFHTDAAGQSYCNDRTRAGQLPTSKGVWDDAGFNQYVADAHYDCEQTYWDQNNRVPCALGLYKEKECCSPEMCTAPLSYTDAFLWCRANYDKTDPMPPCNVVDPGDVQGEAPAVRQPAPPDASSPRAVCDDLFTGNPGGICRAGDNITLVPECLAFCMDPKTNNAACEELVQNYCARYPTDVLCGCVIGLDTFQRDNPTVSGTSQISSEQLVGCFDSACVKNGAYKTVEMQQKATTTACPNVCVEVLSAASSGAYSPLSISEPKFKQDCSNDYYQFQQFKKNAQDNVPPPIPFYPPVLPDDHRASDDMRRYVGPSVIAVGVYVIVWGVVLAVVVMMARRRRGATTVPTKMLVSK